MPGIDAIHAIHKPPKLPLKILSHSVMLLQFSGSNYTRTP